MLLYYIQQTCNECYVATSYAKRNCMTTTLKEGDLVLVNSGIKPILTFTITEIATKACQG
ncbi:hypothetical protein IC229_28460 [Spirosoma sp. BT702]|uniref:Uncharacterized protein n=1 Tax=Spirosoma profusum TaxID=2771354 RepID=A0A926Y211_9BACT|nr:hypothetical protein [Spirosoma profusum]MBD2704605.1 hypothetical protein [Spirosoma profusum]